MLPPVIEPDPTRPAHDDPWLRKQLAQARGALAWSAFWAVIGAAGAVTVTVTLPGASSVVSAIALGAWVLLNLLSFLGLRKQYRFRRSDALRQPWRPVPAGAVKGRVIARTETGVLVLREPSEEHVRIVRARGRIWLCGTDRGYAVVRCDGRLEARALTILDEPAPEPDAPEPPPERPADDPAIRYLRLTATASGVEVVLGVGGMLLGIGLVVFSASPLDVAGIGIGVVFAAGGFVACYRRQPKNARLAVAMLGAATHWTPLPVDLHPKGVVAGYAAQHGDRKLLVTVRYLGPELLPNITATGMLWVAGDPSGEAAIGLPGYPFAGLVQFTAWPSLD